MFSVSRADCKIALTCLCVRAVACLSAQVPGHVERPPCGFAARVRESATRKTLECLSPGSPSTCLALAAQLPGRYSCCYFVQRDFPVFALFCVSLNSEITWLPRPRKSLNMFSGDRADNRAVPGHALCCLRP